MNRWLLGARVRTLPAAAVPVSLGAAVGAGEGGARWWTVPVAAVVSVALQVGVNYANDYSDGVRGVDDVRIGPPRLVAGGLAAPRAVKLAALAAFAVAAVAGLVLALATSWWLIVVGLLAVAAAWGYTGGPKPYATLGLGELFVFVFFGLVATAGTTYVVLERIPAVSWALGAAAGALSCSLLVVNNLRDIPTDAAAGKRTLAVRSGVGATRRMYVALVMSAFALLAVIALDRPWAVIGFAALPLAWPPIRTVTRGAAGRDLIAALGATGRLQLGYGALVTLGVALSG